MAKDLKQVGQDALDKLSEKTPEIVKDNKFALVGALVGFLLTDNKQAQSTILGAVAGSLLGDKKDDSRE
jgi:hypothetical protein